MSPRATSAARAGGLARLGFLGAGWIGRARLEALTRAGAARVAAIADPDTGAVAGARELAPEARACGTLDELLELELDGLVIATPSALHAEQARAAFARGLAVFCQKPLARTASEARAVVEAARAADRLLGVDLSYRTLRGVDALRAALQAGELGHVFAVELAFHNAYGPDKPWFRQRAQSGGGCVIDLGVHLVDLLLWMLGAPRVDAVQADLFAGGRRVAEGDEDGPVEDYAEARLGLDGGRTVARLACSWNLHAGCEAEIRATFHGTHGGARVRNVEGSFYDFVVERLNGTQREELAAPPDPWGGRALVAWAERLGAGAGGFDPEAERYVQVAEVLDRIYGRAPCSS